MNNREAFEVIRRDKLEELLDEYFDLAVEKGRNFERNGLRSNQVRKEILSLFDLASQAQQEPVSNLNHSDIALLKQWFNAVQDLNPKYLNEGDFQLLAKLRSQEQQTESQKPVAWVSKADLATLHEGHCVNVIPHNDDCVFDQSLRNVALYALPPAPEGDKPCEQK